MGKRSSWWKHHPLGMLMSWRRKSTLMKACFWWFWLLYFGFCRLSKQTRRFKQWFQLCYTINTIFVFPLLCWVRSLHIHVVYFSFSPFTRNYVLGRLCALVMILLHFWFFSCLVTDILSYVSLVLLVITTRC